MLFIYSILRNGGKPKSVMKEEVRPWETEVKSKVQKDLSKVFNLVLIRNKVIFKILF